MKRIVILLLAIIFSLKISSASAVLLPDEILVIANGNNSASIKIAEYYISKRKLPKENILILDSLPQMSDEISRHDYDFKIAAPIKKILSSPPLSSKIRCLVTTYGIPYKVGSRGILAKQKQSLEKLKSLLSRQEDSLRSITESFSELANEPVIVSDAAAIAQLLQQAKSLSDSALVNTESMDEELEQLGAYKNWLDAYEKLSGEIKVIYWLKTHSDVVIDSIEMRGINLQQNLQFIRQADRNGWDFEKKLDEGYYTAIEKCWGIDGLIIKLNSDIDLIVGRETAASVDSELSMLMFDDYELYKSQPNEFKTRLFPFGVKTLMVSRLDGPDEKIPFALIDKAITAEQTGLKGIAYIDAQGLPENHDPFSKGFYDQSLRNLADTIKAKTDLQVVLEGTQKLFGLNQCPRTAIYCGWYSLANYVDAFEFVDGAVGYHIASWEARNLHDPNSSEWCPSMLKKGITATLGAVAEPYLNAFPLPDKFFAELIKGSTIVEAYYKTNPFNSWQLILIADPLYQPFKQ